MRGHKGAQKAPALRVIEEDVDHRALHLTNLAPIRPELHLEQQRHATVPCLVEGQVKVPAPASVEGRRRDEEDIIQPCRLMH